MKPVSYSPGCFRDGDLEPGKLRPPLMWRLPGTRSRRLLALGMGGYQKVPIDDAVLPTDADFAATRLKTTSSNN